MLLLLPLYELLLLYERLLLYELLLYELLLYEDSLDLGRSLRGMYVSLLSVLPHLVQR